MPLIASCGVDIEEHSFTLVRMSTEEKKTHAQWQTKKKVVPIFLLPL